MREASSCTYVFQQRDKVGWGLYNYGRVHFKITWSLNSPAILHAGWINLAGDRVKCHRDNTLFDGSWKVFLMSWSMWIWMLITPFFLKIWAHGIVTRSPTRMSCLYPLAFWNKVGGKKFWHGSKFGGCCRLQLSQQGRPWHAEDWMVLSCWTNHKCFAKQKNFKSITVHWNRRRIRSMFYLISFICATCFPEEKDQFFQRFWFFHNLCTSLSSRITIDHNCTLDNFSFT